MIWLSIKFLKLGDLIDSQIEKAADGYRRAKEGEMVEVSKKIVGYGDVMQNGLANVMSLLSEDFEGKSLEEVLAVVEESRKRIIVLHDRIPALYELAAKITP